MYIIVIEETDNDARLVRAALRKAFPEKQVLRYKKANDFFDGIVTVSQMGSRTTTTWPRRIWNSITATKKRRIFVPSPTDIDLIICDLYRLRKYRRAKTLVPQLRGRGARPGLSFLIKYKRADVPRIPIIVFSRFFPAFSKVAEEGDNVDLHRKIHSEISSTVSILRELEIPLIDKWSDDEEDPGLPLNKLVQTARQVMEDE